MIIVQLISIHIELVDKQPPTNKTDYPYNTNRFPIVVTPSIGASISIKRFFNKQFNQWPFLYSECIVDEAGELMKPLADPYMFEQTVERDLNFTYSRDTCLLFCAQQKIVQECNCTQYPNKFEIEAEAGYCLSQEQLACVANVTEVISASTEFEEYCLPLCPLECNRNDLDIFVSNYKYPPSSIYVSDEIAVSASLIKYFSNQTDFTGHVADNMVQINVFYETLSYTQVEEDAKYTFDNLVGTLGGHLHLFLGMSLLSFVEVVEFLFQALHLGHRYRKNRSKATDSAITVKPIESIVSLSEARKQAESASSVSDIDQEHTEI